MKAKTEKVELNTMERVTPVSPPDAVQLIIIVGAKDTETRDFESQAASSWVQTVLDNSYTASLSDFQGLKGSCGSRDRKKSASATLTNDVGSAPPFLDAQYSPD